MRILIVSQYFPPEVGAPQARLYELAMRLQRKGHVITVLTAMPNYPQAKVFPGYRGRLRKTETLDGLRVVRTAIFPSKSRNIFIRLFSYFSFVITSVLFGIWGLGRQDVAIIESPPPFLGPSGFLAGWWTRSKTVFMVSDIWPDIVVRMGEVGNPVFIRLMEWLERFCYRRASCVALTNPGAVAQVRSRFPNVACTVISNGVDRGLFRPELRSDVVRRSLGAADRQILVGYCGLHGLAQGLEVILQAADRLRDRTDIRIIMVGDGPTKTTLVQQAEKMKLPNIAFLDQRPKSQMPQLLASLDASLIPLLVRLPGTMPSKFYEALAAGVPAIVAKGCEAEPLVERFGVGLAYEPKNGAELAECIARLADDSGERRAMTDRAIELSARFDRNTIAERTERILQALVAGEPLPQIEW